MSKVREFTLGGRKFAVPPLPFRANREIYPLCRKLHNAGLIERAIQAQGALDCTTEEMDDLAQIAFLACGASTTPLSREEFDVLPLTPPELLDAYFEIRVQTGGWVANDKPAPAPGEAQGTPAPRKSRPRK